MYTDEYPYTNYPEFAYDELDNPLRVLAPIEYAADVVDGHVPFPYVDPEDRELGLVSLRLVEPYD